jgi:HSP20 family molecular chaperone IbpA
MNNQSTNFAQRSCTAGTFSQKAKAHQQRQQQQQQQQLGVRAGQEKAAPNPPAELSENHEWMRLTLDLPGVQLKDLDVNINDGVLTVEGSRRTMSVDGSICVKKQRISRRYAIDTNVVDVNNATANIKFGVLTIKAPKNSKPNRVQVAVTEDDEGLTSGTNVAVDLQPNMIVLPVTPTRHAIVAPIQAAPIPLTSDDESRLMTPLSSTSAFPRVAIVKEEHGVVQSGGGINDSSRMQ